MLAAMNPEVHGHRGSRGTHPENTMPAFQEAADCGAEFLELDLQLSADNVPMVYHDPEISPRLCQRNGRMVDELIPVRTLTATQITSYEVGATRQVKFPEQKTIPGCFIPSFDTVLQWAQKTATKIQLNVELKQETIPPAPLPDPLVYAERVVDALRRHGMLDRARIQSFDFAPLKAARRIEPGLVMACLFEEERDFIGETLATGATIIAPDFKMVTPELIREAHQRSLRVIPWTVNDPAWWTRLTEWGIDGIITDYPRKLMAAQGR